MTVNVTTQERLRELLRYDPDTGIFTWLKPAGRWGRIPAGTAAGYADTHGYIKLSIGARRGGRPYAHRLAWLYMTGEWPTQVDHINGNRADNRWSNLRVATPKQNAANRGAQANNTSGAKGVTWYPPLQKWHVQCAKRHIGYFPTVELAAAAYLNAARVHYGDFANGGTR